MELERLREVRHIQREIDELEQLKKYLYYPVGSPNLTSEGFGSTPGDPTVRAVNAIREVEEQICDIQNRLAKEVSEILDWIYNDVHQSELRQIFICHYLQGMSWEQTTMHVLGYVGSDTAKKRVYRYFDAE